MDSFDFSSAELQQSVCYCRAITTAHYENFPVASVLIPTKYRWAVEAVYAFARTADDLADEAGDKEIRFKTLREFRKAVLNREKVSGKYENLFPALYAAMDNFNIPDSLLLKLLDAFEYDMTHEIFPTWEHMLAYCQNSAQPVGRIILIIFGYRDAALHELSDSITTALQLANFWQDISIDFREKNRIYVPQSILDEYSLSIEDFSKNSKQNSKRRMVQYLVRQTRDMFMEGLPLVKLLQGRLKWEIALTIKGGISILNKVDNLGEHVFSRRPVLSKMDFLKLIFKGLPHAD